MKALRLLSSLLLFLGTMTSVRAQVVTTQPAFFRETDQVTITFDASQGNRALQGFTGPVYIWTGVVTNLSPTLTTWRHVKSPTFSQGDPAALMTRSATNPNLYTISFTPRTFYPVPANETILRLGMIFKDAAGNTVGRNADGSDIFIDVFQGGFAGRFTSPTSAGNPRYVAAGTSVTVRAESSAPAQLTLSLNNVVRAASSGGTDLGTTETLTRPGRNVFKFEAYRSPSENVVDSLVYIVRAPTTVAPLPVGTRDGVTYLPGGTSVILKLTAPAKEFVYVIGEFNNFQADGAYAMNQTPNGNDWWVQINGLTPGQEYSYQYFVDGQLRIPDPYAEKILDPNNDRFIPAVTYPNLKPYPTGRTTGIVSVLQTNQVPYQWTVNNFQRPSRTDLVIYELHLRDFVQRHDYQTLIDTLGYLQRLGVNAIELMPVNEFEGNDSWGYNPSFFFAPDKYYGTKNDLKRFIDEAHRRGMAVVLDMVLNHACGQSPMVQMYFDGGSPAANSPWFNRNATHPFNVCYDFNHESPFTKYFSKQVMSFWLQEYRIDGYRFDLSKGFTQRNTGSDVGLWSAYDQSRINIWKDYHDHLVSVDPTMYPILEHFADNSEEQVLANYGLMLWGNLHGAFNQAAKGQVTGSNANLTGLLYRARNWNQPHLVGYMESHDEERLAVEVLNGGLASGSYNTRDFNTAMDRLGMNTAFFFGVPGPKMIWQFGELGYDVSINFNGRTGAKPIRWYYYQEPARRRLFDVYASMAALKKASPAFETTNYTMSLTRAMKVIHLNDPSMDVTILGNFGLTDGPIAPDFQRAGKWYNYLKGDSITVTDPGAAIQLAAGEYAVYTSVRVKRPASVITSTQRARELASTLRLEALPNPASTQVTLRYQLTAPAAVTVTVQNMLGAVVRTLPATARQMTGAHEAALPVADLPSGIYLVRLSTGEQMQTTRLVVQH
ncbi:T9SS type A sorting domain-containing protein [Hymenobacter sp. BT175]|uniref:DUF4961 domain-containing protein n=1 Tax=Hymenobacter translucens TaxID=2886507 RepID=UPI001D0DF7A0|nr:alpha-amylase family glycosyl hydrolase [Hymenobacter translucens]MCC2545308.1 T9SS type A sorting domain-containing protein [Hymenobacter translucens]